MAVEAQAANNFTRPHNYKALKEAHVSNLSGGSIWEINSISLILPTAVLLWSVLQSRLNFFTPYSKSAAFVDFLINCGAILCAVTIYANQPLLLNAFLLTPAFFAFLNSSHDGTRRKIPAKPPQRNPPPKPDVFPIKPFVSMYRGHMMIITCIAILAVDFHAFPRRFAKVETWGTSLMDLGVGSFVFSGGVISARAVLKEQLAGRKSRLSTRLKDATRHSIPLLVLGLVRLYSVKGVDYAEHVTEYGVHWNFFFTLGFIPLFMAFCHSTFSLLGSYEILALFIAVGYQFILDQTSLKSFILTAPRTDLLSQNREGIFSLFGYLSIFLAGHGTGMYVLPRSSKAPAASRWWTVQGLRQLQRSMTGKLATWTMVWIALLAGAMSYRGLNIQVSRRLANLSYFLWVAAFNCGQLTICATIEVTCFPTIYDADDVQLERKKCRDATSRLMQAVNRNGLAIFLVANLLTGAVNLTLPTLDMKTLETMAVLVGYMGILSGIALLLDAKNVSIKL